MAMSSARWVNERVEKSFSKGSFNSGVGDSRIGAGTCFNTGVEPKGLDLAMNDCQISFLRQPVQRQVHGLAAPEVQKVTWGNDATLPAAVYAT